MKPKVASKEIGDALFSLFLKLAKSDSLDRSISEIVQKRNEERANWESVYLKIVAMDFGVHLALGNNSRAKEILDIFYERIELMAIKEDMSNKFFMQDLKDREFAYSDVIKHYSPEKYNNRTLIEVIGENFTEIIGISRDDRVITEAASIFGATYGTARDFIKSF